LCLLIPVIFRRAYECVRVTGALNSVSSPRETVHKPIDYGTITSLIQQFRWFSILSIVHFMEI